MTKSRRKIKSPSFPHLFLNHRIEHPVYHCGSLLFLVHRIEHPVYRRGSLLFLVHSMEHPVYFRGPLITEGLLELLSEVHLCLFVGLFDGECLAHIADVVKGLELGDAAREHHGKKVDDEVGVLPEFLVRQQTQFLEPGNTRGIVSQSYHC